jgi:hypothetical protein
VILRAAEKMKRKEVIIAAAATPAGPNSRRIAIQIRDLLKYRYTICSINHLQKVVFLVVTIVTFCYFL